ncbi:hypothetical protein KPH14_010042 [Odynerus spinipes]|uniref:N-acetyltransferase domain-containing protein n=1 Tax=Odynerus spinipes TaxID=1348599 RepID=A0AAD9VTC5_9HYME|nr:hypothetical protein KPH14_010042 [Odynerus spinipes]
MALLVASYGAIEYTMLTKERLEDALRVQASTMLSENIAIGVGMFEEAGAPEEMQLVFREVVKDGISIIAVDTSTGEVVGVGFNKIHIPLKDGEEDALASFVENNIKHRSCHELINFLNDIESKVNFFERYNADAVMEIFYIATDSRYRGRGIGSRLMESCLEVGKKLQSGEIKKVLMSEEIVYECAVPKAAFAVCTTNFTHRIAEKLNFEALAEVRYMDCTIKGRKLSERIDNNHEKEDAWYINIRHC